MKKQVYIVAVDGSEWSDRAANRAISLAEKTGAQVEFLTAFQWSKYHPLYIEGVSPLPEDTSKEEQLERESILDPLEDKFADSKVSVTSEVVVGHPARALKDYIKKKKPNMVFVGRRGRSKVADLVLGSVANTLAHTASVPIVLVP